MLFGRHFFQKILAIKLNKTQTAVARIELNQAYLEFDFFRT